MEEVEVKFTKVDVPTLEKKLVSIGAVKEFGERLYRRKVYDYPDLRLNSENAWVRVRDEVDKVTLGFKQRQGASASLKEGNDTGMVEVEVVVDNFNKTSELLERIGMKTKFYEENTRIRYTLGEIEFDIDHWPLLDPYLEIEAKSWEQIDEAIELLELNPDEKVICSTFQLYEAEGINELDYDILTFDRQVKK